MGCHLQRLVGVKRVTVAAAGGNAIQTPVMNVEGHRRATFVIIADGAAAQVEVTGVSVGDLADGSDMQAIAATVNCVKNGADVMVVRMMQIYGKYVRLDINAGGAANIHIIELEFSHRDSDNIQPDVPEVLVCDVICNKPA